VPRIVRAHFTVERNYRGWRLDRDLMEKIRRLDEGKAAFLIAERLDAEGSPPPRLSPDSVIQPGLAFSLWREAEPEPPAPLHFGVVHDDGELLVVDKPAGLPIHPTARYFEHTFTAVAKARYPDRKVDPAHRLDRETSGLLACGTSPEWTTPKVSGVSGSGSASRQREKARPGVTSVPGSSRAPSAASSRCATRKAAFSPSSRRIFSIR